MAAKLSQGLEAIARDTNQPGIKLLQPVQANEVFLSLPAPVLAGVFADGHTILDLGVYSGQQPPGELLRCVCSWDTKENELDALLESVRKHAGGHKAGEVLS